MRLRPLWVLALLMIAGQARAQSSDLDLNPLSLQVHGFASQGFLVSTANNYLAESSKGSFEFTEVGINFTKSLTPDLRVGLQLFARDLGPTGNYSVKADWFYLDYRFRDWLGIRAGRVKVPFGLYNEVNDIDSARVPVLLPQSTYPIANRDFLLAQTGVELYGYRTLDGAGALDYRIYGGTIFVSVDANASLPYRIKSLNVPYVVGARLMYETPIDGLRLGGSLQALRLDTLLTFDSNVWMPLQMAGQLPASFNGDATVKIPAVLWTGSVEYAAHDLLVAAEYGRWHTGVDSSATRLFPEQTTVSERMYALIAYRINTYFQPGTYYALYFPDTRDRKGRDARQHDLAVTLRFDVNQYWLVKLEGHYLNGTAELSPDLNGGTPRSRLTRSWGLLLAKTTAYF